MGRLGFWLGFIPKSPVFLAQNASTDRGFSHTKKTPVPPLLNMQEALNVKKTTTA